MKEKRKGRERKENNQYYFSICDICVNLINLESIEYPYVRKYYLVPMECFLCESNFICGNHFTLDNLESILSAYRSIKIESILD